MNARSVISAMIDNKEVPSFLPVDWNNREDSYQLNSEDLDGLFDEADDEFSEGAITKTPSTQVAYQDSTAVSFTPAIQAGNQFNTTMIAPPQVQQPVVNTPPGQPFVNVYMIVDPTTQQVYCPQQVIVYNSGEKVQTAMFGPIFMNDFSKEGIQNLSKHVLQRPLAPTITPITKITSNVIPHIPSPAKVVVTTSPDVVASTAPKRAESTVPSAAAAVVQTPLRALSAYNFFFRDERERILHGGLMELTPEKQTKLLQEHWLRDRTKKRRHRKTHGKIDFTTLSKMVSKGWKELPEDRKSFYRQTAAHDWERYQTELSEQKEAAASNTIEKSSLSSNSNSVDLGTISSSDNSLKSFQSVIA